MDIEKLTKSQIVLLTLLISFVTSIATGIVTVSLMDQAPPAIAQTVNRIVEHTVEKVMPAPSGQAAAAGVVTREKTVVVKETDLIAQAVERISPSIVHLYDSATEGATFLGIGIVLDESGSVITDAAAVRDFSEPVVAFADGARVKAAVTSRQVHVGTARLKLPATTAEGKQLTFKPATLSGTQATLGQSIVAISGRSVPRIADGLVTAVIPLGAEGTVTDTNIPVDSITSGSPLINTDGAVVGVSTSVSRTSSQGGFISSSALLTQSESSAPAE